ncbi:6-bladed beta-propeller [Gemmatimonadota bacterium]
MNDMRTHTRALFLTTLLLLPATGCSDRNPGVHQFSESIEDGVPVARNTGGPRHEGELFDFEQVATLHQDTGVPESLLYPGQTRTWDAKGFVMDEAGWFYVQDRGNCRLAVFDPGGRYARGIGRRGDGPGEFGFPHLTGITPDGLLEVFDDSLHRISFFRTDGLLQEVLTLTAGSGRVWYNFADDTFTERHYLMGKVEEITTEAAGFRTFNRAGDILGQASTPAIELYYDYYWAGHKGGVGGESLPFTSDPDMSWAGTRGVCLINGREPAVWCYHTDGTLLRKIILDLPVQMVTRADRLRYTADLEAQIAGAGGDVLDRLMAVRETLVFPRTRSNWRSISVDDRGYLWLEVPEWEVDIHGVGEGCLFQVLSPDGEFLGSARAPAAGRIMNGHLLGVVSDRETGREEYVAWRLDPRPEGFVYP